MIEPQLIRNDSPHQVSMPEGTNVAAGKKANASEPSIRKVLSAADESMNEYSVEEQRIVAPEASLAKSEEAQPSFNRQLKEGNALAPETVHTSHSQDDAAVLRSESDHMELLPEDLPVALPDHGPLIKRSEQDQLVALPEGAPTQSSEQGPLIKRSEQDQLVALPEAIPTDSSAQGPLIKRSEQDRFVALPDPVPETLFSPSLLSPSIDSDDSVAVQADTLDPDTAELSEAMVAMLQMDFPARVVKLKIENDTVRKKLDALQDSYRN